MRVGAIIGWRLGGNGGIIFGVRRHPTAEHAGRPLEAVTQYIVLPGKTIPKEVAEVLAFFFECS